MGEPRSFVPAPMPSSPSRAGRFKSSKRARVEVRQAVELAKELGLYSVGVRGAVWTLNQAELHKGSSSDGKRCRTSEGSAGAAVKKRNDEKQVAEREPRPPNRKKRRSRARMEQHIWKLEADRAQRGVAPAFGLPTAISTDDDVASSMIGSVVETNNAPTLAMDDERAPKRHAQSPVVAEGSNVSARSIAAAGLASCLSVGGNAGRPSPAPMSDRFTPPGKARRRLTTACDEAAASASNATMVAARPWGARAIPLGLPRE